MVFKTKTSQRMYIIKLVRRNLKLIIQFSLCVYAYIFLIFCIFIAAVSFFLSDTTILLFSSRENLAFTYAHIFTDIENVDSPYLLENNNENNLSSITDIKSKDNAIAF